MFSNIPISWLAFCLRRFPLEAGRWRLLPLALRLCREAFQRSTPRCIRTRHGFRMHIDVSDWLGRHLFVTGEYEPSTTALFKRLLRPGDTFLDIGANAGYFTLLGAKMVGKAGRVLSFEPIPAVRKQLEDNIRLNGEACCVVYDVAVSNVDGTSQFFVGPQDHLGTSSMRAISDFTSSIDVRTARLDDLLADNVQIAAAKIDVEGAECHVLEGMQGLLARCHPDLVLEITPQYLQGLGRTVEDIDRLLQPLGYRAFAIENTVLRPLPSLAAATVSQFNAYCTIRDDIAALLPA
ncbi:MAG: FkbM family methyltransferase [Candidatus Tectimicrobiota bacterium]